VSEALLAYATAEGGRGDQVGAAVREIETLLHDNEPALFLPLLQQLADKAVEVSRSLRTRSPNDKNADDLVFWTTALARSIRDYCDDATLKTDVADELNERLQSI